MCKIKRDQKYYSIRKIYECNKLFNFVISEREAGKIKYKKQKGGELLWQLKK